mgnify:CR=1 FL=1
MKRTYKRGLNLIKLSYGCAPCLKEALEIKRKVNNRQLNEIKISQIKKIVNSIFENKK